MSDDGRERQEYGDPEQGIHRSNLREQEKAKKITSLIREQYPKVKTQIQGEEIRVVSPKRDDLQAVMRLLEAADLDFPISYTNFR